MKHTLCIPMAIVVLAFAACSDDETTPHDVTDILALTGNASLGQGIYTSTCGSSSCHGPTGDNTLAGDLPARVPQLSDAELADIIRYGVDTPAISASMPPQGETEGGTLTAQEIANVMAHVKQRFSGAGGAGGN